MPDSHLSWTAALPCFLLPGRLAAGCPSLSRSMTVCPSPAQTACMIAGKSKMAGLRILHLKGRQDLFFLPPHPLSQTPQEMSLSENIES